MSDIHAYHIERVSSLESRVSSFEYREFGVWSLEEEYRIKSKSLFLAVFLELSRPEFLVWSLESPSSIILCLI